MEKHFNIIQRLQEKLPKNGDAPALIQPNPKGMDCDESLSYNKLEYLTQAYAQFFTAHDLNERDQVLLLLPPGPEFYAIFLGLMRVGATAILVDPGVGLSHMRACLDMVKPSALIGVIAAQCLRFLPELFHLKKGDLFCPAFFPGTTRLKPQGTHAQVFPATKQHPALITFTSGSTGRPKAIVRTHGFLLNQGDALAALMPADQKSVELCTFPVFTLANLSQGITTLMPPSGTRKLNQINYALLLDRINRYHVNRILAAPNFCMNLFTHLAHDKCLYDVEHIHTGGGPVYLNLVECLQKAAPNARIMALYGSTEAEPIALENLSVLTATDRLATAKGKGLLAGVPVPIINLRIINDQTGSPIPALTQQQFDQMTQSTEQIGEIVVTGDLVQKSYMNPSDNQETKFEVDGHIWHRTGDAGHLDRAGRLWLQGRCNAKVNINNKIVYPFALEAAATLYPQIFRAAFVQVKGCNILALEGQILPAEIQEKFLQDFPYLDKIVYLEKIPVDKRHSSKVLYAKLREMLARNSNIKKL